MPAGLLVCRPAQHAIAHETIVGRYKAVIVQSLHQRQASLRSSQGKIIGEQWPRVVQMDEVVANFEKCLQTALKIMATRVASGQ